MNQVLVLPIWKTVKSLLRELWIDRDITFKVPVKRIVEILIRSFIAVMIFNKSVSLSAKSDFMAVIAFSIIVTDISRSQLIYMISKYCNNKGLVFEVSEYNKIQYSVYIFVFYSIIVIINSVPGPLQIAMWNFVMPVGKIHSTQSTYTWNIYNIFKLYVISFLLMMIGTIFLFLMYGVVATIDAIDIVGIFAKMCLGILAMLLPTIGMSFIAILDAKFSLLFYNFPPYSYINRKIQRFIGIAT